MKVTVVRTGGFTGIEVRGESDTGSDPVLRRLLDRVDLSAVPTRSPSRVPDQFRYEITIDDNTVIVGEARLTAPLRELVHHVLMH